MGREGKGSFFEEPIGSRAGSFSPAPSLSLEIGVTQDELASDIRARA
jgi:hypothetical protein